MTPLTEMIIQAGDKGRIFSVQTLQHLLAGSDDSRYGLVNRALKKGEILQIKRGLYILADQYRDQPVHPFVVAQQMSPGSFISLETALSFHGWIPEGVTTTASMIHGGKSSQSLHEPFGLFSYHRMTVIPGSFLSMVQRHTLEKQVSFIADPLRALLDMVYLRKLTWQGIGFIVDGLRIEEDQLRAESVENIKQLECIYRGKREQHFIKNLLQSLSHD